MPPVPSSAPGVSKSASGARLRSPVSSANDAPSASRHTGMFTKNTHRHPGPSDSTPAEEHSGSGGETADRAPDAERRVAVGPFAERGSEDRQRRRGHHRGADTLEQASSDQHAFALRKPRGERADGKPDQAGEEHPPAPEQVSEPATEQQEASIGQQVAARDPLQVLLGEMQRALDRRERHVRDRGIDHVQKLDTAEQQQRQHSQPRTQQRGGARWLPEPGSTSCLELLLVRGPKLVN